MGSGDESGRGLRLSDVSHMAAIITLPHIGVSTITAFLIGLVNPAGIVEDIPTVIGFILVSFPLTLATALVAMATVEKELTFVIFLTIIVVSGIASNLLALAMPAPPYANPEMFGLLAESSRVVKGPLMFVVYAYRLVSVWWESYGPLMFVQSVAIGSLIGYRLASRDRRGA